MPRVLRAGEKCPLHWIMPRTKAGRDELKRRMDNILRVLPLLQDPSLAKFIESNLVSPKEGETWND
tara:strand:+ start:571 stop:768 length:198 start_codon:yes stop_codon:yes gene_type:complete